VWNDRKASGDPFMAEYENLLEAWGENYRKTTWRTRINDDILGNFFEGAYEERTFDNQQILDEDGLIGRFVSSSYMPARGTRRFIKAEVAARELFARWQKDGQVTLRYDTLAFLGKV
jgi:hypothetical protein